MLNRKKFFPTGSYTNIHWRWIQFQKLYSYLRCVDTISTRQSMKVGSQFGVAHRAILSAPTSFPMSWAYSMSNSWRVSMWSLTKAMGTSMRFFCPLLHNTWTGFRWKMKVFSCQLKKISVEIPGIVIDISQIFPNRLVKILENVLSKIAIQV